MLPAFEKHRETHSLEVTDVSNESNYLCAAVCMNKDTVAELAGQNVGFVKHSHGYKIQLQRLP